LRLGQAKQAQRLLFRVPALTRRLERIACRGDGNSRLSAADFHEGLDKDKLRTAFEGEQREEVQRITFGIPRCRPLGRLGQ
jgi:hypothetical protein